MKKLSAFSDQLSVKQQSAFSIGYPQTAREACMRRFHVSTIVERRKEIHVRFAQLRKSATDDLAELTL
ncbi:MAG: hypothetical protein ACREQP_20985 [Candidatus Binatia bacterium]